MATTAGRWELVAECDGDAGRCRCRRRRFDGRRSRRGHRERLFDDELGFRPRDEDGGRDVEVEAPELPVPGDVGDRFACGAASDQRLESGYEAGRRGKVPRVRSLRAVPAEHVAREHLGVERGVVLRDAGADERRTRPADLLAQRSGHCSLSFSDWKKVDA